MGFEEIEAGKLKAIDADGLFKLLASISTCGSYAFCRGAYTVAQQVLEFVKNSPTVDTVKRGKWINGDCSECGFPIPTDDRIDFIQKDEVHYCYNCGAKMDGGTDGSLDRET